MWIVKSFLSCYDLLSSHFSIGLITIKKELNMELMKKIFVVIMILASILFIGFVAGDLDHDEYIEANSTPKVKIP